MLCATRTGWIRLAILLGLGGSKLLQLGLMEVGYYYKPRTVGSRFAI